LNFSRPSPSSRATMRLKTSQARWIRAMNMIRWCTNYLWSIDTITTSYWRFSVHRRANLTSCDVASSIVHICGHEVEHSAFWFEYPKTICYFRVGVTDICVQCFQFHNPFDLDPFCLAPGTRAFKCERLMYSFRVTRNLQFFTMSRRYMLISEINSCNKKYKELTHL
jgi:hypothetical protein